MIIDYLIYYSTLIIPLWSMLWIVKKINAIQKNFKNWKGFYHLIWIFFALNELTKRLLEYLFMINLVRSPYVIPLIVVELFILGKILFISKNVSNKLPFIGKFLKVTNFLYSIRTQKQIFEPIAYDWEEEYFEALFKKEIWKARWINLRYTYAFLAAMWQKSPIGDLIQFVIKIAKQ